MHYRLGLTAVESLTRQRPDTLTGTDVPSPLYWTKYCDGCATFQKDRAACSDCSWRDFGAFALMRSHRIGGPSWQGWTDEEKKSVYRAIDDLIVDVSTSRVEGRKSLEKTLGKLNAKTASDILAANNFLHVSEGAPLTITAAAVMAAGASDDFQILPEILSDYDVILQGPCEGPCLEDKVFQEEHPETMPTGHCAEATSMSVDFWKKVGKGHYLCAEFAQGETRSSGLRFVKLLKFNRHFAAPTQPVSNPGIFGVAGVEVHQRGS